MSLHFTLSVESSHFKQRMDCPCIVFISGTSRNIQIMVITKLLDVQ